MNALFDYFVVSSSSSGMAEIKARNALLTCSAEVKTFATSGFDHNNKRLALLHPLGKTIGLRFFIVKTIFRSHFPNFTSFGCGRFFHNLLFPAASLGGR